ncbi:MAG TPA: HAD-IA family hydrolase [Candidatus Rubrimentiphilum sp.]|nr:HAD-IA family hydrolase [Candidatus Rubrimentiphilum sp.]
MRDRYDALLFDLYGTLVDESGEALPGAAEALESVRNGPYAIVTSCPRRFALRLLESAGLREPPVMVAAEDVSRGKPAPEGYLRAAERLEVEPENCLVLEDSAHGVAAARAAGMDVVAVDRDRSLRDLSFKIEEDGTIAVR